MDNFYDQNKNNNVKICQEYRTGLFLVQVTHEIINYSWMRKFCNIKMNI